MSIVDWKPFDGEKECWDEMLISTGEGKFHQCFAWGEYRLKAGWEPLRLIAYDIDEVPKTLVQVLVRQKYGVVICWIPGINIPNLMYLDYNFRKCIIRIVNSHLVYCRINII